MHNLALALHDKGYHVTGSDDEVYEPSRTRLKDAGLLPTEMGWHEAVVDHSIDAVILGMHARIDNPELKKAQELGLSIYSYPEYVAREASEKQRVVIAGSHGKTTTTSIVMNALNHAGLDYDYLVGAQIEGYDRMVRLSDAPLIILEGDEYLSSPIDRRPKMMHYRPHIAVITGIAWDHINVFPTFENYVEQFDHFVDTVESGGTVYYFDGDPELDRMAKRHADVMCPYHALEVDGGKVSYEAVDYPVHLIGRHNYQNLEAARRICLSLGLDNHQFLKSLETFKGASKRLECLREEKGDQGAAYLDFAHAPSKVRATVAAVAEHYDRPLHAVLELHTFSSLNQEFLPQYDGAMCPAKTAAVFYNEHTLEMKQMPPLSEEFVQSCFGRSDLLVMTEVSQLEAYLKNLPTEDTVLLMTSGNFRGLPFKTILTT